MKHDDEEGDHRDGRRGDAGDESASDGARSTQRLSLAGSLVRRDPLRPGLRRCSGRGACQALLGGHRWCFLAASVASGGEEKKISSLEKKFRI